jgi:RNA polymerase sigma-70 factor (ECF subfamily)
MSSSRGKLLPLRRPASQPAVSEAALVAACAVGDAAALGALFDLHHRQVERFIARMSWCTVDELADLVQTTFLQAYRGARRFKGQSSVKTWLLGIATNVARHHVRGEVRRRAFLADVARRPRVTGGAGPEERAAHRQLLGRVEAALADLTPELRAAFVLCDLEEVPGVEAARALGIREGTLWWRLHEARKALRAALADGADGKERP